MAIIVPIDYGDGTTERRRVEGHTVSISSGGETLEPTYVKKADINLNGNSEAITTNCGRTEVRRNGTTNWNVDVEGIITQTEIETLQNIGETDDPVFVEAEVLGSRSGSYLVEDVSITHTDEINTIEVPTDGGEEEKPCYKFQIQLKSPE